MSETNGLKMPRGWARTTLAAIVEPRTGKADPQATPAAKFIGMEHVEAHTMRLLGTIPAAAMKSGANTFQPTDVLYGRMRSYLNKVYQPDFPGLCSGEFIVFPETCAVLGRFLKYRLNAGDFVRFANRVNTGDRPRVDFDQIKVFEMPLPPRSEQERIADALDELLSDLDAGVAGIERVLAKLAQYRAAVLKAAVEGALTADWRKKHRKFEPASALLTRILAERRRQWEEDQLRKFKKAGKEPPKDWKAKYKEPVEPNTTNLPPLPDGWCWATVEQLNSGDRPCAYGVLQPGPHLGNGVPLVRIGDINNGKVDLENLKRIAPSIADAYQRTFLKGGELLISLVGAIGRTAVAPNTLAGANTARAVGVIPLSSLVHEAWVEIWFRSPAKQNEMVGKAHEVARKTLNLEDVRAAAVALPQLTEQDAIVEAVEDQLSVVEHLEADLEAKLKSAQALRQSILRHAFTGQLVPQHPKDEPAAELLKRIAAEREERAARTPRRGTRPTKAAHPDVGRLPSAGGATPPERARGRRKVKTK